MAVAVAHLAVKALASCARPPRNLIVHGAAFFAPFAARVALALAFLMLKDNAKRAYQMPRNVHVLRLCVSPGRTANAGDLLLLIEQCKEAFTGRVIHDFFLIFPKKSLNHVAINRDIYRRPCLSRSDSGFISSVLFLRFVTF